jgi:hypothetical protein
MATQEFFFYHDQKQNREEKRNQSINKSPPEMKF